MTIIVDKDAATIDSDNATGMPSDRNFRNAWKITGTVITEDLTAAKVIFRDKIREVRGPLLEEQDVLYMKALEDDDSGAQTTIAATKTSLRDAPADTDIDDATDMTELKAAWNTSLLGTSPYA